MLNIHTFHHASRENSAQLSEYLTNVITATKSLSSFFPIFPTTSQGNLRCFSRIITQQIWSIFHYVPSIQQLIVFGLYSMKIPNNGTNPETICFLCLTIHYFYKKRPKRKHISTDRCVASIPCTCWTTWSLLESKLMYAFPRVLLKPALTLINSWHNRKPTKCL